MVDVVVRTAGIDADGLLLRLAAAADNAAAHPLAKAVVDAATKKGITVPDTKVSSSCRGVVSKLWSKGTVVVGNVALLRESSAVRSSG